MRQALRSLRRHPAFTLTAVLTLAIAIALAFTRLMRGMLFGIQPLDAATYLATALLVAVVAIAAMAVPARHATKIDPVTALRTG